jgi:hypothetical protein
MLALKMDCNHFAAADSAALRRQDSPGITGCVFRAARSKPLDIVKVLAGTQPADSEPGRQREWSVHCGQRLPGGFIG